MSDAERRDDSEPIDPGHLADFARRREASRRYYFGRAPKRIDNVLAQVVQRRGYAQIKASGERDELWQQTLGNDYAGQTRLGALRRGVIEVEVANSLLMQDLTFRKEELLAVLREAFPDAVVKQIRFRVGNLGK
jgi:predicted nucleic acid-binding Zn ribbon protein